MGRECGWVTGWTGAVHTHGSLAAQTRALREAWAVSESDRLLHALPLHHIHGAVAALHTAHSAGACVEMLPRFSPVAVWASLQVRWWCVTFVVCHRHSEQSGTSIIILSQLCLN